MASTLHPDVAALAPLLGTWEGSGHGEYPTIEPFDYVESVSFTHVGKPFLAYQQRTRADDGRPLHAETGYLRTGSPGAIELMLAHPTGVTELAAGTIEVAAGRLVLELRSTTVATSATAKEVTALERTISVVGDELSYTLRMAAVGQPLRHHLAATLRRAPTG